MRFNELDMTYSVALISRVFYDTFFIKGVGYLTRIIVFDL